MESESWHAGTTMRAIVQETYGDADMLRLETVARPEITENEVLVRVHAAGLDRGTWHLMAGQPYVMRLGFGLRGPRNPVPGIDVAGTVVAAGPTVTGFAVGDEVFGFGRGTFAEYAAVREDRLARKPANITFEQAAVIPVSASTALQALTVVGRAGRGQQVLVVGASGGVGSYAVQLAKALGAEVTGVCSASKVDLVRSLGADHVLDYARDDFADGTHSDALCLMKATLWDVKTGARLFEQQAEGMTKKVGPAALVDDGDEIERARNVAMETLLQRLTNQFAALAGTQR